MSQEDSPSWASRSTRTQRSPQRHRLSSLPSEYNNKYFLRSLVKVTDNPASCTNSHTAEKTSTQTTSDVEPFTSSSPRHIETLVQIRDKQNISTETTSVEELLTPDSPARIETSVEIINKENSPIQAISEELLICKSPTRIQTTVEAVNKGRSPVKITAEKESPVVKYPTHIQTPVESNSVQATFKGELHTLKSPTLVEIVNKKNNNIMARPDWEEIQNLVEKRIPLFYGQSDIDPNEVHYFLDGCKRVSKLYEEDIAKQKSVLEEIILRLRGKAYETFRDAPPNTIEEFCNTITQNFLPRVTLESLRDKLLSAKQHETESCNQYSRRIRSLALDYNAGVHAKYGEANTLPKPLLASMEQEAFIRGLKNPVIKASLAVLLGKSIKELVQVAENLESRVMLTASPLEQTYTKTEFINKCQLCDKWDHQAKDCALYKESKIVSRKNFEPQIINTYVQRKQKSCKYCKNLGHEIQECRKKKFADKWRMNNNMQPYQDNHSHEVTRVTPNNMPNNQDYHLQQTPAYPKGRPYYNKIQYPQSPQRSIPPNQNHAPYHANNWQFKPNTMNSPRKNNPNFAHRKEANYRDATQGIEEHFQKMSINYVDSEEICNQGNQNGLADIE